jgi:MoaD family protein
MKVNFYATFRPIVGGKTVLVAMPVGATVQQLVNQVIDDFPALGPQLYDSEGKLFPHVHVFVNGRDAPYLPCAMETVLNESDTVDIFPPVGGG